MNKDDVCPTLARKKTQRTNQTKQHKAKKYSSLLRDLLVVESIIDKVIRTSSKQWPKRKTPYHVVVVLQYYSTVISCDPTHYYRE